MYHRKIDGRKDFQKDFLGSGKIKTGRELAITAYVYYRLWLNDFGVDWMVYDLTKMFIMFFILKTFYKLGLRTFKLGWPDLHSPA